MTRIQPAVLRQLKNILGQENVRTDELSLALNSYDCSLSRFRPDVLLTVTDRAQLPAALAVLSRAGVPFTPRAAATNHAGSCVTLYGGAVLNLNALDKLLCVDCVNECAEAEPALVNERLQFEAGKLGFFYAPDPASERVCTLGGNLAQNASGARCMKYGNTLDHVHAIDFITPAGQVHSLSKFDGGPNLLGLVCGSEGTLGVIAKLRVKLTPLAKHLKTFLVTFNSLEESVQTVSDLVASGIIPRCVEAMDKVTTQAVEGFARAGYPTDCEALLIIELDGDPKQMQLEAETLEAVCRKNNCASFLTAKSDEERRKLWLGRRAAYAAMARLAPNVMVGDGTVPRSKLPEVLKKVRAILEKYNIYASLLFHAGDGNLHPQIVFNERQKLETLNVSKALKEILQACVDCGGTISGEHGIGVEKRGVMAYQYDRETLRLFTQIKKAFDPQGLANPGKLFPLDFETKAAPSCETDPETLRLQAEIKQRFENKQPTRVTGSDSRLKTHEPAALSAAALNRVLEIDQTNYTATAQAGIALRDLWKELKKAGVYALLPQTDGTLGGLVAGKTAPAFENQLLGLQAILPNGDLINYGGKLMKNAAGYNLNRLFTGSLGRFGLLTKLTFKIYAAPQPAPVPTALTEWPHSPLLRALQAQIDPHALFGARHD